MPFRWSWSSKSPVLTTSLIIIALNVVVISFVFTINDVQVPIKPAAEWALHRLCEFGPIKRVFDTVRNSVGLPDLKLTKQRKHIPTTPNEVHNLLSNAEDLPIFTKEQLALFDGSRPSKPVYLAILGRIYDVQKGKKHYAPGGGYHFFAGKDATRAFVTGDFSEAGLTDDVSDLNEQELLGILDWVRFYEKDYKPVGVLEGIYYDDEGEPTDRLIEVKEELEKAVVWKEKQLKENEVFPPCNSEWNKETGGRVWCTTKSGGVTRDWAGVPRRLFNAASKSYRCACVKNFGSPLAIPGSKGNRGDLDNPSLKEYEDCSHTSNSCKLGHNN
uniref:Cytochrome b5 heme-binding domain-containing protein n=1 Tax=Panagrellus redivivus TaxID=6233 RepID=A0A7E4VNP5_PANRE